MLLSHEAPECLWMLFRYESDDEDLEWGQLFNGVEMDCKTDVRSTWPTEAQALLDSLRIKSPRRSRMDTSEHGLSAAGSSHQHSLHSQLAAADTNGLSNESHSPPETNGFGHGARSQSQANGRSHDTQPQSPQDFDDSEDWQGSDPGQAVPPNKKRRTQADGVSFGAGHAKREQRAAAANLQPRFTEVHMLPLHPALIL